MAIAPEDIQAITQAVAAAIPAALKAALQEEVNPEETVPEVEEAEAPEEAAHYAENDDDYAAPAPDEDFAEDEDLNRDEYEAAEPSGSNTFVPGAEPAERRHAMSANRRHYGAPSAERDRMQADSDRIRRSRYERDLAKANKRIADLELANRRANYERTLVQLEAEGFDLDRADEMGEIDVNTPADFEQKREKQIRAKYRRNPVGQDAVPTVDPPAPAAGPKALTRDQIDKISRHATKNGTDFATAKTALGFK